MRYLAAPRPSGDLFLTNRMRPIASQRVAQAPEVSSKYLLRHAATVVNKVNDQSTSALKVTNRKLGIKPRCIRVDRVRQPFSMAFQPRKLK